MFSGLIVLDGSVQRLEGDAQSGMTLVLDAPGAVADGVALGDSIAVNGACLTVELFVGGTDFAQALEGNSAKFAARPGERVSDVSDRDGILLR